MPELSRPHDVSGLTAGELERTKRELAARQWTYVREYAEAKGPVVEEILARARGEAE